MSAWFLDSELSTCLNLLVSYNLLTHLFIMIRFDLHKSNVCDIISW